jgi:hypothetical protein
MALGLCAILVAALSLFLGRIAWSNEVSNPRMIFRDITREAGINFHPDNAASNQKYLIETMGSGCAFLDYDQDGLLDILLINGGETPSHKSPKPILNALYHNDGNGHFTDVTAKAGLGRNRGFGMGVAVGDFDNDGYPDIFISGFPASTLYHNNRNGTFTDVTLQAGVENRGNWGTSAAWVDFDNDGYLDLLVGNYVDYAYDRDMYCGEKGPGYRMYCHPKLFGGSYPVLYRNQHDGTFRDVTAKAGLQTYKAKALAVLAADFDNDGWMDIFIANDTIRNLMFRNRGDGTYTDVTMTSGTGYSADGVAEAGMGADAADYGHTGLMGIFVSHLDFELNRLYENKGNFEFLDATMSSGLGRSSVLNSAFGARFVDVDNDGWKDLVVVNGHVLDNISLYRPDVHYAEKKLLYRNAGGRFEDFSGEAGPVFERASVGRGLAAGDFDNDGRVDFLVSNNGQPPELIHNETQSSNNWLGARLIGVASNRDGIGARLQLTAGALELYDQAKGGMSYLSASDPRIYFGLGTEKTVDRLIVKWPSGKIDTLTGLKPNRIVTIKEGEGEVAVTYPKFIVK